MKHIAIIFLLCIGFLFGLIGTEAVLRILGEKLGPIPALYQPEKFVFNPPFTANTVTGWQLKPGQYELLLGKRDRASHITIGNDASRITRASINPFFTAPNTMIFVGDSFIFGEGLDNEETLPWRVQELLPSWNIVNHGVGGFGTCQSFLRLQQLPQYPQGIKNIFVYGLSSFHEERNTADPRHDYWVAIGSPNHISGYPRCSVQNNSLIRGDPKVWPIIMPFTGQLVISRMVTDGILSVLASEKMKEQRSVTEFLLLSLKREAENRGGTFIVLLQELTGDNFIHYKNFLTTSNIAYVDGTAIARKKEFQLPDGHPGPEITRLWATKLVESGLIN